MFKILPRNVNSRILTSFQEPVRQKQVEIVRQTNETRSQVRGIYRTGQRFGNWSFNINERSVTDSIDYPRLSPQQVTSIIQLHGATFETKRGAVSRVETNKLASNTPIEDRHAQAKLNTATNQYLFGIYDGHAGCACSQALSERLFHYIALTMLPPYMLEQVKNGAVDPRSDLIHRYTCWDDYVNEELTGTFTKSLMKLAIESLAAYSEDSAVEDNLRSAFLCLDQDISMDALPGSTCQTSLESVVPLAFAGSCALVAFVDETDLYIANVGDSRAILGVRTEQDQWEAVDLSVPHCFGNKAEEERIIKQHPNESPDNLLAHGRLLGDLAPLRAFGDVRFKWSKKDLKHIVNTGYSSLVSIYGNNLIPRHFKTPPYLTAEPEVIKHHLSPKDKFLVLASDGLWEFLEPHEVIKLVAGHMEGREVLLNNFELPKVEPGGKQITLGHINELLLKRKLKLALRPQDSNAATHLLRNALGPGHGKLSQLLSIPKISSRNYRDDITVTIVYFDTEYITNTSYV
ncbi:hypothetical protein CHS0354_013494 [Potamilus streckersoni]|uniref:PPM-type phosphatase domain-containing protein n=1 Tax=Potamilus streckersoni TaxID=2493646 RepID=A0AAE0T8A4_9BIVA|nr:hypothetical protein CHS0354_013494 [Potamilus streckersoni]